MQPNQSALEEVENNPRYTFEQVDICDLKSIESVSRNIGQTR